MLAAYVQGENFDRACKEKKDKNLGAVLIDINFILTYSTYLPTYLPTRNTNHLLPISSAKKP